MSSAVPTDDTRLTDIEQLVAYVSSREKRPEDWVVGTEHEKFGWWPDRQSPPDYHDPRGIGAVLKGFVEFGWVPHLEEGSIVALSRDKATITLEPAVSLN